MIFEDLKIGDYFICPSDSEQPTMMKIEMCDRCTDVKANYCNAIGIEEDVRGQLTWIDADDEVERVN
jgi:hypothetical protein